MRQIYGAAISLLKSYTGEPTHYLPEPERQLHSGDRLILYLVAAYAT